MVGLKDHGHGALKDPLFPNNFFIEMKSKFCLYTEEAPNLLANMITFL